MVDSHDGQAHEQTALIDLRSDVLTRPTEAMWSAMYNAEIGWAGKGEDPTVNELENLAAELTGKESALLIPTGTMANLVALMSHTRRGEQVILETSSHIYWSEEWSYSYICGVTPRPIAGILGYITPEQVQSAILEQRFDHRPRTSLICLENTHNAAGGTVITPAQLSAVTSIATEHNIAVHLDGARLCNAAVALRRNVQEFAAHVDSLTLNLNKGLSAPEGALLCGSYPFIERSRTNLKRLGGHSMHKAGIYAAAGLVALHTMIPHLADDHRRARRLAEGLAGMPMVEIDLEAVQTNIVMAKTDPRYLSAGTLVERLAQGRIKAYPYTDEIIRFVTHRHIRDEDIDRVLEEIAAVLNRVRSSNV